MENYSRFEPVVKHHKGTQCIDPGIETFCTFCGKKNVIFGVMENFIKCDNCYIYFKPIEMLGVEI